LGAGSWELGAGSWELGAGSWELGAGSWELGAGCWVLGAWKYNYRDLLMKFENMEVWKKAVQLSTEI